MPSPVKSRRPDQGDPTKGQLKFRQNYLATVVSLSWLFCSPHHAAGRTSCHRVASGESRGESPCKRTGATELPSPCYEICLLNSPPQKNKHTHTHTHLKKPCDGNMLSSVERTGGCQHNLTGVDLDSLDASKESPAKGCCVAHPKHQEQFRKAESVSTQHAEKNISISRRTRFILEKGPRPKKVRDLFLSTSGSLSNKNHLGEISNAGPSWPLGPQCTNEKGRWEAKNVD